VCELKQNNIIYDHKPHRVYGHAPLTGLLFVDNHSVIRQTGSIRGALVYDL